MVSIRGCSMSTVWGTRTGVSKGLGVRFPAGRGGDPISTNIELLVLCSLMLLRSSVLSQRLLFSPSSSLLSPSWLASLLNLLLLDATWKVLFESKRYHNGTTRIHQYTNTVSKLFENHEIIGIIAPNVSTVKTHLFVFDSTLCQNRRNRTEELGDIL